MSDPNSANRKFFRIDDIVFIELKPINDDEVAKLAKSIMEPVHSANYQHKSQMHTLQNAFTHLTDHINLHDREIARALRLLDEKVNLLANTVQQQLNSVDADSRKPIKANLSAGGIAFTIDKKIEAGKNVELNLELRPSGALIHAIANVVSCEKAPDAPEETPFLLKLVFNHMSDLDRNLLVKHTLSLQAEALRAAQDNDYT
ncbi:MAG: PilZ domain-containing protein [Gammaproteobacteria bacterium]|nr:PilZ domain-containing protein [Gammaproteobacteria bacterium]